MTRSRKTSDRGVQHSPATGRLLTELIVYGEYRSLDVSRLGYQRIIDDEPIVEDYVIGGS